MDMDMDMEVEVEVEVEKWIAEFVVDYCAYMLYIVSARLAGTTVMGRIVLLGASRRLTGVRYVTDMGVTKVLYIVYVVLVCMYVWIK